MNPSLLKNTLARAIDAFLALPDLRAGVKEAIANRASWTPAQEQAFWTNADAIETIERPILDLLAQAWDKAIAEAQQEGLLRPVTSKPSNSIFQEYWDLLLSKPWSNLAPYERTGLTKPLSNALFQDAVAKPRPTDGGHAIATRMLDAIASGTLPRSTSGGEPLVNFANGEALAFALTAWAPHFWARRDKGVFRVPTAMPKHAMLANVTFPSGQLLVADAISVGGMWDKVRDLLRRNHLDVCYPWHRMEGTMLALAQMHYVNIHGTSDGPGLVQSLDTGHLFGAPATDGFSNVANVCHDYWGTSIVDQEHVISAMVQAGATRQEALTAIAGWETESPHHTRIAVTPGTWCVLWDEDGESVEKALATSGINHPKGTTFALFPTPPAFPFGSVVNLTA